MPGLFYQVNLSSILALVFFLYECSLKFSPLFITGNVRYSLLWQFTWKSCWCGYCKLHVWHSSPPRVCEIRPEYWLPDVWCLHSINTSTEKKSI